MPEGGEGAGGQGTELVLCCCDETAQGLPAHPRAMGLSQAWPGICAWEELIWFKSRRSRRV